MTHNAYVALRAAKNAEQWGEWATMRYVENNGCPMYLLMVALICETQKKEGWR